MRCFSVSIVATTCSLLAAPAGAAPAVLLNKTITVSANVTIPGKRADGSPVTGSRVTVRTIYISSAGRAFARVYRRDGQATQTRDVGPSERGNTFRFVGEKLIGVMHFVSGAAQMTVSFDPSGQSCSAEILAGRDNGRPLKWKSVNGMVNEATGPATISNVSCSIATGNAFANQ